MMRGLRGWDIRLGGLKDGSKKPKTLGWLQPVNPLGEGTSDIAHQSDLFSEPLRFGIGATDVWDRGEGSDRESEEVI